MGLDSFRDTGQVPASAAGASAMKRRIRASRSTLWLLLLLLAQAPLIQSGCGYVAAGAAGAAIGHEIAEENDEDDD